MHQPAAPALAQMQVSAGRVTPVLLNGVQLGGGWLERTSHEAHMTAVLEQEPPEVVAVKDTVSLVSQRERGRSTPSRGYRLPYMHTGPLYLCQSRHMHTRQTAEGPWIGPAAHTVP